MALGSLIYIDSRSRTLCHPHPQATKCDREFPIHLCHPTPSSMPCCVLAVVSVHQMALCQLQRLLNAE